MRMLAKFGQVPEGGQIHTGDVGDYAEGDDHQAQDPDHVDKRLFLGDAVGADLGEGHEAHQAGEGEEAEAQGDQQGHGAVEGGARSQLGAGGQEPRELVHLEPGVGAVGEPTPGP